MKHNKAFTLIETLIVIVVFGIGILAVLHGLSQTLRNKDYADIQIKSAFFAREGIELMFNLRDANHHKELPRNCIFQPVESLSDFYEENENPFCDGYFGDSEKNKIFKIGMGTGNNYINIQKGELNDDFDSTFDNFQIYLHNGESFDNSTGYIYNYEGYDDEKTRFARYILLTGVLADDENIIDTNKLLKIESHVLYRKGPLTGERVMETFIGNYEFNQ